MCVGHLSVVSASFKCVGCIVNLNQAHHISDHVTNGCQVDLIVGHTKVPSPIVATGEQGWPFFNEMLQCTVYNVPFRVVSVLFIVVCYDLTILTRRITKESCALHSVQALSSHS